MFGKLGPQRSGKVDRFVAEILAERSVAVCRGVSVVEDQHDNSEHDSESILQVVIVWGPERDRSVTNLRSSTHEALFDGGRGEVERAGDFGRAKTADGPEGEGDLGRFAECWVRTHEVQVKHVVACYRCVPRSSLVSEAMGVASSRGPPAGVVDDKSLRHGHEPPVRVVGWLGVPRSGRAFERCGGCVLGCVQVAKARPRCSGEHDRPCRTDECIVETHLGGGQRRITLRSDGSRRRRHPEHVASAVPT